mgnify:CR=1 FL=1
MTPSARIEDLLEVLNQRLADAMANEETGMPQIIQELKERGMEVDLPTITASGSNINPQHMNEVFSSPSEFTPNIRDAEDMHSLGISFEEADIAETAQELEQHRITDSTEEFQKLSAETLKIAEALPLKKRNWLCGYVTESYNFPRLNICRPDAGALNNESVWAETLAGIFRAIHLQENPVAIMAKLNATLLWLRELPEPKIM